MSWNGDQMNFKMVIGMLQCEKHTMENDARQGWDLQLPSPHTSAASRNYFNWILSNCKAKKIEKTKSWDLHVVKGVFNTSGFSLPIPNYFKLLWSELLPDEDANGQGQNYHVSTTLGKKGDIFPWKTPRNSAWKHILCLFTQAISVSRRRQTRAHHQLGEGRSQSFHF